MQGTLLTHPHLPIQIEIYLAAYSALSTRNCPPPPSPYAPHASPDLDLLCSVLRLENQKRALRHLLHTPHTPEDVLQLIETAGNALEPSLGAEGKSDEGRSDMEAARGLSQSAVGCCKE